MYTLKFKSSHSFKKTESSLITFLTFYTSLTGNFLANTTKIEIDSDSRSSGDELPDPRLDETLPLVCDVKFIVRDEEVTASFPNNICITVSFLSPSTFVS